MKKKLLVLLLSFILPVIAFAQFLWVNSFYDEDNGVSTFGFVYSKINKETLNRKVYYRVWEKYCIYDERDKETEYDILNEYDSSFTKYRSLSFTKRINGEVIYSDNEIGEWNYIIPETNGEAMTETIKDILNGVYK